MASAKDKPPQEKPKADELAQTGEAATASEPAPEIPSRAAKRAGRSAFTVTALGSVKHEGKFFGPGSTLELTDEQAADFGAHIEPKK